MYMEFQQSQMYGIGVEYTYMSVHIYIYGVSNYQLTNKLKVRHGSLMRYILGYFVNDWLLPTYWNAPL